MRLAVVLALALLTTFPRQLQAATFEELSAAATAARNSNDIPRAINLYRQALEANPKWPEGWWFLGTFLYSGNDYSGARDAFKQFVQFSPKAGPAWGLLALSEFQTGEYAEAANHIRQSLALGSDREPQIGPVLLYHEALLLARNGNFDGALRKYVPFLQRGVQDPELLTGLGIAALRRRWIPREVPADQKDLIVRAGNAAHLMLTGKTAEAERAFEALLAKYPTAANVHYLYGCFLFQTDAGRAMDEMKKELAVTPGNPAACTMLALGLLSEGDAALALPYAEKGAAGDPVSSTAQYVLGRALVETGNAPRGISHLESAVAMDPGNLENHLALATAYPKAGRYQDAKRQRRRALELSKGSIAIAHP